MTDTKLTCTAPPVSGHRLMLVRSTAASAQLLVLDVSNPVKPIRLCELKPADGGRFISATRLAFWHGQTLGSADLASGMVSATATLPLSPSEGAYSPDGSAFAYRVFAYNQGSSTHLFIGGKDRPLVTVGPIGGRGGPPYGPVAQLEFSADARYLLDFSLFIPTPGPPQLVVYRMDGSIAFQSAYGEFGAWAPAGARLYFLSAPQPGGGMTGDVHSWDPTAGENVLVRGSASYMWPRTAPDGKGLIFDAFDNSVPGCLGLPHPWRLDFGTHALAQLSTRASLGAVFVSPGVIWSDEEQRTECGPGGASGPTGRVLAHDLASGRDSDVDLGQLTLSPTPLSAVLDVWLS